MKKQIIELSITPKVKSTDDIVVQNILKAENITKNFGGITAIKNCSIKIETGKLVAIIGPNGSGKSTLFHIISGLVKEDAGNIFFKEENIGKMSDYKRARLGISRTFQDVRLFRNLTIRQHMEIAMEKNNESIYKSILGKLPTYEEKIVDILNLVNLYNPLDTQATDLSYGQRKLLDLAIAIAMPHSLLMLDEPVAGINQKFREDIKEVLTMLKKDGETIIIIEHDMNFVMDIADHIYVLDNGSVIAQGNPDEIQNNPKVLSAYLGV